MARIKYYYDNRSFDTYDVVVKASTGMLDVPERKEMPTFEWADMNGHIVDTTARPRYKERIIELQCSMYATSAAAFTRQMRAFASMFRHEGLRPLKVEIPGLLYPLFYLVYAKGGITINKRWSENTMVGTFSLKFEEPEPMKIVYSGNGNVEFEITFKKMGDTVNVFWGHGETDYDITAVEDMQTVTINHTVDNARIIIITGDVEYATITAKHATEIWNLL